MNLDKLCKFLVKFIIPVFVTMAFISGCTGNKDVQVWVASPWEQVLRSTAPGTSEEANLKSAANEYEPFRIIIRNGGQNQLENVNVQVDNLKGKEGNVISSDNIKLLCIGLYQYNSLCFV